MGYPNKTPKLIIATAVMSVVLVGCLGSERLSESVTDNGFKSAVEQLSIDSSSLACNLASTPGHVELDLTSTLSVDAKVSIPPLSSAKRYTAKKRTWEYEEINSIYGIGTVENTIDASTYLGTDKYIAFGNGQMSFGELDFLPSYYQIVLQYSPNISSSKSLSAKDLDFMTVDEARAQFEKLCDDLGLSVGEETDMISLDLEMLNKEAESARAAVSREELSSVALADEDYYRVYSSNDEAHILIKNQQQDGVPLTRLSYTDGISGMRYGGTVVRMFERPGGIAEFYAGTSYEGFELLQEEDSIVSLDVALDELSRVDSMVVGKEAKIVHDIRLELVPRPNPHDTSTDIITLAWVFSCDPEPNQPETTFFIDAFDGESF